MSNNKRKEDELNPNNPANALIRQSASEVVNSWMPQPQTNTNGTTPPTQTLSQEAINSYTNKVQSLYDYENQQRATADANFQKSLKYLPQQFKQAGLYGSGQSESTLVEMNNAQLNRQNAISAETNKGIRELQEKYNDDVENLNEQTKLQVDEVANYISQVDFSNYSAEDFDNFKNYITSAGYSEDVWNKAVNQIQALNPELAKQINLLDVDIELSNDDINKIKTIGAKSRTNSNKIRYNEKIAVSANGKTFDAYAGKAVSEVENIKLDKVAKLAGVENKAGAIVYYNGELYVQSGQNKGWRVVYAGADSRASQGLADLKGNFNANK